MNNLTGQGNRTNAFVVHVAAFSFTHKGLQGGCSQAIRGRKADYVLAVKNNQPKLAEAISNFFTQFRSAPPAVTPHSFHEQIEKDHDGRIEHRRFV